MKALVAALAAALPLPALANVGVGFLTQASPTLVVALPLVILIEAPLLARFLPCAFKRGLVLSAKANALSTIAGFLLSFLVDGLFFGLRGSSAGYAPSRELMMAGLVPFFLLSWWIEALVVRRSQRTSGNVVRAVFLANLVSYVAMAIATWLLTPPTAALNARTNLTVAMAEMGVVRTEESEQFQRSGRFGPARGIPPSSRFFKSLRVEENGRIVAVLSFPEVAELDAKEIIFEPRVEGGSIVEWRCRSSAPPRHLPPACR